ncbi:MAG: hypothetical protein ACOX5T_10260, partial [Candidatus Cryptobacteroides sp.]
EPGSNSSWYNKKNHASKRRTPATVKINKESTLSIHCRYLLVLFLQYFQRTPFFKKPNHFDHLEGDDRDS